MKVVEILCHFLLTNGWIKSCNNLIWLSIWTPLYEERKWMLQFFSDYVSSPVIDDDGLFPLQSPGSMDGDDFTLPTPSNKAKRLFSIARLVF